MSSKKMAVARGKGTVRAKPAGDSVRQCGLCRKTKNLTRTECCGQWICNDEDDYVMFSYARNSCFRNHRRQTLCGFHGVEGHSGDWRECKDCRDEFPAEMVAFYGTNEYNFVKLQNPPSYEPTRCDKCRKVIRLAEDSYTISARKHFCTRCSPVPR